MKRDLKPFVVEVKRGTRRSSFLGQLDQTSTMSEAQRRAEATLFSPTAEDPAPKAVRSDPSRRILQSLVEPVTDPVPDDEEALQRERRPRPVGRPRKTPVAPAVSRHDVVFSTALASAPAAPIETPVIAAPRPSAPAGGIALSTPPAPEAGKSRGRLRDRSSILARYVLGTKPAPGERWVRTTRRSERRGRTTSE